MTVEQRLTHLRSNHLCFNCLAPGHKTADCRSYGRCRTCRDKHHTLVHQDKPPSPAPVAVIHAAASTGPPTIQASLTMTSKVLLTGPTGQTLVARALLDSGSTISLITARTANTLKLPRTSTLITFSGVQDSVASPSHSLVNVCLSPLQESEQQHQIVAAVVSTVTCDLPLQGAEGVRDLPHLKGLKLADPTFYSPGRIDLLIGENILARLLQPPDIQIGPQGTPSAWKTIFGWAIRGPFTPDHQRVAKATNLNIPTIVESPDWLLTRFWETEEPPKDTVAFNPEEVYVQNHYTTNHVFLPSAGRYEVALPRKPNTPPLGESRTQALQRYVSNERALMRKGTWEAFQKVIQEYLDLGHAQPVPPSSLDPSLECYYLPMHGVVKESSSTTKLRVVFDASAKSSNSVSLNDSLCVGPTLHPNLDEILLCFRTYPVALTGDI